MVREHRHAERVKTKKPHQATDASGGAFSMNASAALVLTVEERHRHVAGQRPFSNAHPPGLSPHILPLDDAQSLHQRIVVELVDRAFARVRFASNVESVS